MGVDHKDELCLEYDVVCEEASGLGAYRETCSENVDMVLCRVEFDPVQEFRELADSIKGNPVALSLFLQNLVNNLNKFDRALADYLTHGEISQDFRRLVHFVDYDLRYVITKPAWPYVLHSNIQKYLVGLRQILLEYTPEEMKEELDAPASYSMKPVAYKMWRWFFGDDFENVRNRVDWNIFSHDNNWLLDIDVLYHEELKKYYYEKIEYYKPEAADVRYLQVMHEDRLKAIDNLVNNVVTQSRIDLLILLKHLLETPDLARFRLFRKMLLEFLDDVNATEELRASTNLLLHDLVYMMGDVYQAE